MPPDDATEAFQHYRVLRRDDGSLWKLGAGAMGVTYKAIDTNLDAAVALKVINAAFTGSESARERFIREARAAASLRHRYVASVYHLGCDGQTFFYAMEFIDGETVENFIEREGPQSWRLALTAALQVTRALMAAHEKRLVHRDIKPANVMLVREVGEEGLFVKLIDFGLAKTLVEEGGSVVNVTGTGFLGTPLYASPEQCEEIAPDIRSDIYSLGVTLWFVLAGRPPFQGGLGKVFAQHLHAPPPWDQLPVSVPEPVRALLARMLAKDRADRPQTPPDLRLEIEACLRASGHGVPTLPGSEAPPLRSAIAPAPTLTAPVAKTLLEIPPDAAPPPPDAEPPAGFSLEDALRQHDGRLPTVLVADLLRPLAQIVDAAGPAALDVTPSGVRVVTGQTQSLPHGVPFTDPWLTGGEPGWLDIRPANAVRRPLLSANETMPPRPAAFTAPATALAALAYELIGGRPPTTGQDYRPLAECGEAGNRHLRRALATGGFTDAKTFADAFARSLDQRTGTETPAAAPTPTPAAPTPTPAAPVATPTPTPKKKPGCAVQVTVAFVAVVAVFIGVTSLLPPSARPPVLTDAPVLASQATAPEPRLATPPAPVAASTPAFSPTVEAPPVLTASLTPPPTPSVTPTLALPDRVGAATRLSPFENSLGMKFIPVPGTAVLFDIWDTRVADFEVFARATGYDPGDGMVSLAADGWKQRGDNWQHPGFVQGPTHPVVGINWDTANAFCDWLTTKEVREGRLQTGQRYRLPSDEEWSRADGLTKEQGATPKERSAHLRDVFPWGSHWPPPDGAGNFRGQESRIGQEPAKWPMIAGYRDGFPRTSPVGSFRPNAHGLYDMSGNVWQWCLDAIAPGQENRVVRGGSWRNDNPEDLRSSKREDNPPDSQDCILGFRCVLTAKE